MGGRNGGWDSLDLMYPARTGEQYPFFILFGRIRFVEVHVISKIISHYPQSGKKCVITGFSFYIFFCCADVRIQSLTSCTTLQTTVVVPRWILKASVESRYRAVFAKQKSRATLKPRINAVRKGMPWFTKGGCMAATTAKIHITSVFVCPKMATDGVSTTDTERTFIHR